MKKMKFLNGFIFVLLIIYAINYLGSLYLEFFTDFTQGYRSISDQFIFGYYTQYVGMLISVVTFSGLFFVKKALGVTIKKGFFNLLSASNFKIAGYLFLVSGIFSLAFNMLLFNNSEEIMLFTGMSKDVLLMILGFGLLIIVDILETGEDIQQENDLTI